jgi:hypothetical protein
MNMILIHPLPIPTYHTNRIVFIYIYFHCAAFLKGPSAVRSDLHDSGTLTVHRPWLGHQPLYRFKIIYCICASLRRLRESYILRSEHGLESPKRLLKMARAALLTNLFIN